MTIEERVQHAISGLRLKTDELGRPPSHDEVEALLRKTLLDYEKDLLTRIPTKEFEVELEDTQRKALAALHAVVDPTKADGGEG